MPTPDTAATPQAPTHDDLLNVFASLAAERLWGAEYDDDMKGWITAACEGDVLIVSFEEDEERTIPTGQDQVVRRFQLVPLADVSKAGDQW